MTRYIDKDGDPIDFTEWSNLYEDYSYFSLANYSDDKYNILTAWVGVGGFPFHTVVMNKADEMICTFRYRTKQEAINSHVGVIRYMLNRDRKEKYGL